MNNNICGNKGCQSYQKWAIGNDVREMLLANTALTQYVGNNIYPLIAPENTEGEFIIYQRDKYKKEWTKIGVYEDVCHLLVTLIADNYDNAIFLASQIDNTLTGKHTKDTGEKIDINLIDSTESFDDNKYIETLLFEIK